MKRSLWVRLVAFALMAAMLCMMVASCADGTIPDLPAPDDVTPGGTPGGPPSGESETEQALQLAAIRALAELLKENGAGKDSRIRMTVAAAAVASMLGKSTDAWEEEIFDGEFALSEADTAVKRALYADLFQSLTDLALDGGIEEKDLTINQNGVSYTVKAEVVERMLASLKDTDWKAVAERYAALFRQDMGTHTGDDEDVMNVLRALWALANKYMEIAQPIEPEDPEKNDPDYAKKDGETLTPVWVESDAAAVARKAAEDEAISAIKTALESGTAAEFVGALRNYVAALKATEEAGYYSHFTYGTSRVDNEPPVYTVHDVESVMFLYTEILRILNTYTAEGGFAGLLKEGLPLFLMMELRASRELPGGYDVALDNNEDPKLYGGTRTYEEFTAYIDEVMKIPTIGLFILSVGDPYQTEEGEWIADLTLSDNHTPSIVSTEDGADIYQIFMDNKIFCTISPRTDREYCPQEDLMPLAQRLSALILAFDGGCDYDAATGALDALLEFLAADDSGYFYEFALFDIELDDAGEMIPMFASLYVLLKTLAPADAAPLPDETIIGIDERFGSLMASFFQLYKKDEAGNIVTDEEGYPVNDPAAEADFAAVLRAVLRHYFLGEEYTVGDAGSDGYKTGDEAFIALLDAALSHAGLHVNDLLTGDYEKFIADVIDNVIILNPDRIIPVMLLNIFPKDSEISEEEQMEIVMALYAPIREHIVGALRYPTDPATGEKTGERFTGLAAINWSAFAGDMVDVLNAMVNLPEEVAAAVTDFAEAVRTGTPGAFSDLLDTVLPMIPMQEYVNVAAEDETPRYEYVAIENPTEAAAAQYAALCDAIVAAVRVLEVGEPAAEEPIEGEEVPGVDMLPYVRAIVDAWAALTEEQVEEENRYKVFGTDMPHRALLCVQELLGFVADPNPAALPGILERLTEMSTDELAQTVAAMLYVNFFDQPTDEKAADHMADIERLIGVLFEKLFVEEPDAAALATAAADLLDYLAANMTKAPEADGLTPEENVQFFRGALTLLSITCLTNTGAEIDYNERYANLPVAEGAARPDYNALAEQLSGRAPVLTLADPAVEQRMTGATLTVRVRLACDLLVASVNAELTMTFDITY